MNGKEKETKNEPIHLVIFAYSVLGREHTIQAVHRPPPTCLLIVRDRDTLKSNLVSPRRQQESQRMRIHGPSSLSRPRRRASVSSLLALNLRGSATSPTNPRRCAFFRLFRSNTFRLHRFAHLFSYYRPMFKNFHHWHPEVTVASSQPYDPRSRHQRRQHRNRLTRKR